MKVIRGLSNEFLLEGCPTDLYRRVVQLSFIEGLSNEFY